jgi:hypothetical protein
MRNTVLGEGVSTIIIRESYPHASRPHLASFDKIQTRSLTTSTCEWELLAIRLLMMKGGN